MSCMFVFLFPFTSFDGPFSQSAGNWACACVCICVSLVLGRFITTTSTMIIRKSHNVQVVCWNRVFLNGMSVPQWPQSVCSAHHALVVGCHLLVVRHQQLAALLVPVGSAEGTFRQPWCSSFPLSRHGQLLLRVPSFCLKINTTKMRKQRDKISLC